MKLRPNSRSDPFSWLGRLGKIGIVLIPISLLWWAFRQVPPKQIITLLGDLSISQLLLWVGFNAGLVLLMNGRWWLILRVLGHPVTFSLLTRYRLAAFAVSYFTPGPQFGGEPLQVLALRQRHGIPATSGTASVSLDRLLEMIANFTFLVFGVALALSGAWFPVEWRQAGFILSLGLLAFPLGYLVLMLAGRKPLSLMTVRLPYFLSSSRLSSAIQEVESQMSRFCVEKPGTVLAASLVSLAVWVGLVAEYWFLTWILGLRLSFVQAVSALVAARLAILTPLPGGLGVMEASQVLAFQTLGLDPAYGGTIALLVRLRDLLFGSVGLISAVNLVNWRRWGWSGMPVDKATDQDQGVGD